MLKAYSYRLKPSKEEYRLLCQACGNSRFVYNHLLGLLKESYEKYGVRKDFKALSKDLTALRDDGEHDWLKDCSRVVEQQALRDLMAAMANFFLSVRRRKEGGGGPAVGFPKFKRKNRDRDTARYENGVRVDFTAGRIHLEKVGDVKFRPNRRFPEGSRIVNATVVRDHCGDMEVRVLVEDGCLPPPKAKVTEDGAVGVDLGIKSLAALSDGTVIPNPKFMERAQKKLEKLQKAFARTVKGSKHHEELRLKIARLYRKVYNRRTDSIHQFTAALTDAYSTVVIEDLGVSGMMANHNLAGHIQSASFREVRRQLEYKCLWKGVNLVVIGRFVHFEQEVLRVRIREEGPDPFRQGMDVSGMRESPRP